MNMKIESYSTEDTFAFGEKCGREAKAGQVFCLYGDLVWERPFLRRGLPEDWASASR